MEKSLSAKAPRTRARVWRSGGRRKEEMNGNRRLTCFSFLAACGGAIAFAGTAAEPVQAGPAVTESRAAMKWQTFAPPGAGFSVAVPGSVTSTAATYFGVRTHLFRCVTPVAVYGGQYFDVPPARLRAAGPQAVLSNAVAGVVRARNRKLLSLRPISLQGHPGREFVVSLRDENGEQRQAGRVFLVGNHCFMVLAVRYLSGADPYKQRADIFISSFRLLPPLH